MANLGRIASEVSQQPPTPVIQTPQSGSADLPEPQERPQVLRPPQSEFQPERQTEWQPGQRQQSTPAVPVMTAPPPPPPYPAPSPGLTADDVAARLRFLTHRPMTASTVEQLGDAEASRRQLLIQHNTAHARINILPYMPPDLTGW